MRVGISVLKASVRVSGGLSPHCLSQIGLEVQSGVCELVEEQSLGKWDGDVDWSPRCG